MKDFIKKVITGAGISPPDVCLHSLNRNFENAVNVEWSRREGCYEAIFYNNCIEHIAIFSLAGTLEEYRQNLTPEYLPESVRNLALQKGEIMNSVLRNKGSKLEYEIILRDQQLKRHMVIFSDLGEIIEERQL